jgi:predicted O-methyltransferase YrrM
VGFLYELDDATRPVERLTEGIDGWLSIPEGIALYQLARRCSALGAIVEIGSWRGKSTVWLAKGSLAGARAPVFAVDPHVGSPEHHETFGEVWTYDDFIRNVEQAGVREIIVPKVTTSEEAARSFDAPVGLVFIDGAHDYASARSDWMLWTEHVVEGGVVAFHDTARYNDKETRRAMRDAFLRSRRFKHVRFADSITYAEKTSSGNLRSLPANAGVLALKHVVEMVRALDPPAPVRAVGKLLLGRTR